MTFENRTTKRTATKFSIVRLIIWIRWRARTILVELSCMLYCNDVPVLYQLYNFSTLLVLRHWVHYEHSTGTFQSLWVFFLYSAVETKRTERYEKGHIKIYCELLILRKKCPLFSSPVCVFLTIFNFDICLNNNELRHSTNRSNDVLPVSLRNPSYGLYDANRVRLKRLSTSVAFHPRLPDLMFAKSGNMGDTSEKQVPKSFCSLEHLIREVQKVSGSRTVATCSSTSNLKQHNRKPESTNPSMTNEVFEVSASRRRRPQALRARKANKLARKELLLDDSSSLRRRMEEYRRQMKTKTFIPDFDSDSEEDLE